MNNTLDTNLVEKNSEIAFIGWNPFQFRHIKEIATKLPGSFFIVEKRKNNNLDAFNEEFFSNSINNVVVYESSKLKELDGVFKIVICQVAFPGIELFRKTRIIFLQYGYAKDPHNYGIWRAFANINLVYGQYALSRIKTFTKCEIVGNPETDKWHDPEFHSQCQKKYGSLLNPNKETILYAPTWGDLSSIDEYLDEVVRLQDQFNVVIKMHHNTNLLESKREVKLEHIGGKLLICGANDDLFELLSISNYVISDYSGAMFDAFYCHKPIVLLNITDATKSKKEDAKSLEQKHRADIGAIVSSPTELYDNILTILNKAKSISESSDVLWNNLYNDKISGHSVETTVSMIKNYLEKPASKTQAQIYIRKYLIDTYANFKTKK